MKWLLPLVLLVGCGTLDQADLLRYIEGADVGPRTRTRTLPVPAVRNAPEAMSDAPGSTTNALGEAQVLDGFYDNPATLCREKWKNGTCEGWYINTILQAGEQPFGTYPDSGKRDY